MDVYLFICLLGGWVCVVGLLYSGDCVVVVWLGLRVHTISGIACSCGFCVVWCGLVVGVNALLFGGCVAGCVPLFGCWVLGLWLWLVLAGWLLSPP